jgi:hypothetical protein
MVIKRRKGKDGETEEGAAECAFKENTKQNKLNKFSSLLMVYLNTSVF